MHVNRTNYGVINTTDQVLKKCTKLTMKVGRSRAHLTVHRQQHTDSSALIVKISI